MVINTNLTAQTSARLLSQSSTQLSKSLQRLSSGSKLISPEDDPAGMAVSMKFDGQISRLGAAQANIGNTISFSQTQDGFLQQVGTALDRMSQLSVLAQDPTKTSTDDALYNTEFAKLQSYVTDLGTKQFNGVSLFGSTALNVTTDSEGATLSLAAVNLGAAAYTAASAGTTLVDTAAHAASALTTIKAAIAQLSTDRANVGANISVLNSYSDQLGVLSDNLSSANSRIKDVDVAQESASFAKYNILVQSGTAMLAQANQLPQSVLKLLQ
jgi:flagellin